MWPNKGAFRAISVVICGFGTCILLIWVGMRWGASQTFSGGTGLLPQEALKTALPVYPFFELLKLAIAFILGIVVTAVHKHYHRDKLLSRPLEQAETLLCVAGALMMVIIGDSLPRAFGVFGAASLIRFRTPVEDPKDTTILFLLLGIGMACGLGSFGVAGIAALLLCLFLFILDHLGEQKPRAMVIELRAAGADFPRTHVENIFAAYGVVHEAREVSHGKDTSIRYHVLLAPNTPLDAMSDQLMAAGYAGIKSVTWEAPGKRD